MKKKRTKRQMKRYRSRREKIWGRRMPESRIGETREGEDQGRQVQCEGENGGKERSEALGQCGGKERRGARGQCGGVDRGREGRVQLPDTQPSPTWPYFCPKRSQSPPSIIYSVNSDF